jgi:hypothetical protein
LARLVLLADDALEQHVDSFSVKSGHSVSEPFHDGVVKRVRSSIKGQIRPLTHPVAGDQMTACLLLATVSLEPSSPTSRRRAYAREIGFPARPSWRAASE